ncbi:hypothetical protein V2J09_010741 [Rumex salicifolius]
MFVGRSSHALSVKATNFLLLIDDFSRKNMVIFFETESEVFEMFKKFKATVENESGCRNEAMRSDRGGEFTSKEFLEFCEIHGIRRLLTVPRSPRQNGMVGRKNRIILDSIQSLLKSKKLPKEFCRYMEAPTDTHFQVVKRIL